jgi:hypothetical protein
MGGGDATRMEEMVNVYKIWFENLRGRDHLEGLDMRWKIQLQRMLG